MDEVSAVMAEVRRRLELKNDANTVDEEDTHYDEVVRDEIQAVVKKEQDNGVYRSLLERFLLKQTVFNAMRRLDVLQPLVDDKEITEIMINGPSNIFVERNGQVFRQDVTFGSEERLKKVIEKIVSTVNRKVNESDPIADARLLNGSRVNVVYPPIALNGPIVTIRKFPEDPFTMQKLIELGSITPEVDDVLHRMIQAKYNIFISGGTGSGKTTFLNALSNYIPSGERIITIEDSAELQIKGIENLVRLETRNANTEGKGAVSIRDLIRSSLRMRPERIIVGEVRGGEALDMLQAMNTGHDGSLSTGHANSTNDMLTRLEMMSLTAADIPLVAIQRQIASALDIVIHLSRFHDHSRRVAEITEVVGFEASEDGRGGKYITHPLYRFEKEGETPDGKIIGTLKRTEYPMQNKKKFADYNVSDKV